MLYSEFLIGIEQSESDWNYAEYERINAIYNNNNDMSKADAYKLYTPKPKYVEKLEWKLGKVTAERKYYKDNYFELDGIVLGLTKEKKRLTEKCLTLEKKIIDTTDLIERASIILTNF